jgi:hypothetical protein
MRYPPLKQFGDVADMKNEIFSVTERLNNRCDQTKVSNHESNDDPRDSIGTLLFRSGGARKSKCIERKRNRF